MRTFRLARVALDAEAILLRAQARRTVVRLALGSAGLIFLLACFAFLHIALWTWLVGRLAPIWAGLAIAGGDAVLGGILVTAALVSQPGRTEAEARAVRDQAWRGLTQTYGRATLGWAALRLASGTIRRRRAVRR